MMNRTINEGDIFAGTWGATMIIPAFFKVVKVTPKRVSLVEYDGKMVSGDGMQGYEMPDFDDKRGKVLGIPEADGAIRVKTGIGARVWARPWDGRPIWADYMD